MQGADIHTVAQLLADAVGRLDTAFAECYPYVTAAKELSAGCPQLPEKIWRPRRDSNPRYRRERAMSWAGLDDGDAVRAPKKAAIQYSTKGPSRGPSLLRNHTPGEYRVSGCGYGVVAGMEASAAASSS